MSSRIDRFVNAGGTTVTVAVGALVVLSTVLVTMTPDESVEYVFLAAVVLFTTRVSDLTVGTFIDTVRHELLDGDGGESATHR